MQPFILNVSWISKSSTMQILQQMAGLLCSCANGPLVGQLAAAQHLRLRRHSTGGVVVALSMLMQK